MPSSIKHDKQTAFSWSFIFLSPYMAAHIVSRVSCEHLPQSKPQEDDLRTLSIQMFHEILNISTTCTSTSQVSCSKVVTHTAGKLCHSTAEVLPLVPATAHSYTFAHTSKKTELPNNNSKYKYHCSLTQLPDS